MAFMKQAPKRYFLELMGSMTLYGVVLWYSVTYVNAHAAPSFLKTFIALSPMLPVCLAALAIIRFYNRMDEMHRRAMLEAIALGAGFMAIVSIGLGFGTNASLPHLGIIWAWPLMGTGWGLAACYRALRWAVSETGWKKTLWNMMRIIAPVVVVTGLYVLAAPHLGWPRKWGFVVLVATGGFLAGQAYYLFVKHCGE